MTTAESGRIIKELKAVSAELTRVSEEARLDSFLSYYDGSPGFVHISSDGVMRNYEAFKNICTDYYTSLQYQEVLTVREEFNVVDAGFVISAWTGNITARFKNGDTMILKNYSITNLFRKTGGHWKIIHSHESALPPGISKKR